MIVEGWYRCRHGVFDFFTKNKLYYWKENNSSEMATFDEDEQLHGWSCRTFFKNWEYPNTLMELLCE